MARVPWAEPGGRFTLLFENHLIELLEKCRTVKGAAALGRITADQMDGVMARAVKRGLLRRVAVPLSVLGFDEKSYRKGQQYVTVLTGPEGHRVLDVARGRTEATAVKLLEELPTAVRESVKAVVMDMWPAYCAVVYDKFHISMHLNKAVDAVRLSWFAWLETFDETRYDTSPIVDVKLP
jgi:transposase